MPATPHYRAMANRQRAGKSLKIPVEREKESPTWLPEKDAAAMEEHFYVN